ncbi:MAG: BatA domain-containing protein [Elusimicrobiota bacterium]
MTFLGHFFLWLLPLVFAPFILHLLNKRPPKKKVFSYLAWVREAHQKMMPRKKLEEWILLLIRTLILLSLILFFARPVLETNRFSTSSEDSIIFILQDVSASMGALNTGRTLLDTSKDDLKKLLRKLPAQVKVGMIVYSDKVEKELPFLTERSKIVSSLEELHVLPKATNVVPAIDLALQTLEKSSSKNKLLLLVSDQTKTGWSKALSKEWTSSLLDSSVPILIWEMGHVLENAGVLSAQVQMNQDGSLVGTWAPHLQAPLKNDSTWQIYLNNQVIGQGAFSTLGDQGQSFRTQIGDASSYFGTVQVSKDSFDLDNNFYFSGKLPKGYKLLIVDGDSGSSPGESESYFLRLALESPRDPQLQVIKVIRPEDMSREKIEDFQVIFLANISDSAEKIKELSRWIQQGGGLFVSVGSKIPIEGNTIHQNSTTLKWPAPDTVPLNKIVDIENFQWDQMKVEKYIKTPLSLDDHVLLSLANNDPLLIDRKMGKGRILQYNSSIDLAWNNIPSKPFFSPMIRVLLAYLADPSFSEISMMGVVGDSLRIPIDSSVNSVTVISPDGIATAGFVDKAGTLLWKNTDRPGLYQVKTNIPSKNFSFAVNIPHLEQEANQSRILSSELSTIFPNSQLQYISGKMPSDERIRSVLEGKDLTNILVGLLLILLLLETWISWPRKPI